MLGRCADLKKITLSLYIEKNQCSWQMYSEHGDSKRILARLDGMTRDLSQSSSKLLGVIRVITVVKDGTPFVELHPEEGTGLGVALAAFGVDGYGNAETDQIALLLLIPRDI